MIPIGPTEKNGSVAIRKGKPPTNRQFAELDAHNRDFLKYEAMERVFEFIGKSRYYPITQVPADLAGQGVERLRLGIGKDRHYSAEIIEVSIGEAYRKVPGG